MLHELVSCQPAVLPLQNEIMRGSRLAKRSSAAKRRRASGGSGNIAFASLISDRVALAAIRESTLRAAASAQNQIAGTHAVTDIVERLRDEMIAAQRARIAALETALREAVAVERAEIERLRAAREWRPIETAPRDPSVYLILRCIAPRHTCIGVWMDVRWKAIHSDATLSATHWLPIPEPPEGNE